MHVIVAIMCNLTAPLNQSIRYLGFVLPQNNLIASCDCNMHSEVTRCLLGYLSAHCVRASWTTQLRRLPRVSPSGPNWMRILRCSLFCFWFRHYYINIREAALPCLYVGKGLRWSRACVVGLVTSLQWRGKKQLFTRVDSTRSTTFICSSR
jgi:hypothetical protein